MRIHRIFFIILGISCTHYAMEYQKSFKKPESIIELFFLMDQKPLDETLVLTTIKHLKDQDIIVNFLQHDDHDETILYKAVACGSYAIVKELLSIPACQKTINTFSSGLTPLHAAILQRFNALVQLLIEHKVDAHKDLNFEGAIISPLRNALMHKNIEAVRLLVQAGVCFPHKQRHGIDISNAIDQNTAQKLLLDGVHDQNDYLIQKFKTLAPMPRAILNGGPIDELIIKSVPGKDEHKKVQNLMYAFVQRKGKYLRKLLASTKYSDCLWKSNDNNQTIFDLIHKLLFDSHRIRSRIEADGYLPIWQQDAALVGKVAGSWVFDLAARLTLRGVSDANKQKVFLPVPKDIWRIITAFVIGESLFTLVATKKLCS